MIDININIIIIIIAYLGFEWVILGWERPFRGLGLANLAQNSKQFGAEIGRRINVKQKIDRMTRMQQIVDNYVDQSPIRLVAQILAEKRMHNDTRQRQYDEAERDEEKHKGHAANLLILELWLFIKGLAAARRIVADQRVAYEHDTERYDVVDEQVYALVLGEYVELVRLRLVAYDHLHSAHHQCAIGQSHIPGVILHVAVPERNMYID